MGFDALLKNQLGHGPKFQKLHIHLISIPGGRNWAYFRSMGSGFLDNCWFSKLPYLARKLVHWPKFQTWHIYSLSNPRARNLAHSRSTGSRFRDTGQFSYLGMNSKSCTYTLFLPPGGLKLSLFLLYGPRFPRYGPYLGMKLGHWPKFEKLHIYSLSTPSGCRQKILSDGRQIIKCRSPLLFQITLNMTFHGHIMSHLMAQLN